MTQTMANQLAAAASIDADLYVRGRGITFCYDEASERSEAGTSHRILDELDIDLYAGESVILTGPSGAGKTTLLTLIGALRSLQRGSLSVFGNELRGLTPARLRPLRRKIGFIFQHHNLFEALTAFQNVRVALELDDLPAEEIDHRAITILELLGLKNRLHHKPGALSGGQRQRVAIARALVHEPQLILADEPTADLDSASGRDVVDLLCCLVQQQKCSMLMVTHDNRILDIADRIIHMMDGKVACPAGSENQLD